jgi:large subunit ribosomal protein L32e
MKAKKPEFIMQDAHKKKRLEQKWRKPRGSDSKMRVGKSGYRRAVKVGWGSPKEVKHLNQAGLQPVIVRNINDLERLNPKKQIAVIARTVGNNKRIKIIEKAESKGIKIQNYALPEKKLVDLKKQFEERKEERKKQIQERDSKREATKKEAEKKKTKQEKEQTKTEEEIKAEEKKEKDKVLITKD